MTPPSGRRTVDDVAAPYANYLLSVATIGADVCPVCYGMRDTSFPTCYACHQAKQSLGGGTADVTAMLSIAPRGEQLAHELAAYKHANVPLHVRRSMTTGLAAVLWKWLRRHERCLTRPLGLQSFDLITTVPSTSGRENHPLVELVAGIVSGSGARYQDLLVVSQTEVGQRAQSPHRYSPTRSLSGLSVLAVDDTWTSGAHAQSAAAALKSAGSEAVGVLAIGRWFNPSFGGVGGARWLAERKRQSWDWNKCCLEP